MCKLRQSSAHEFLWVVFSIWSRYYDRVKSFKLIVCVDFVVSYFVVFGCCQIELFMPVFSVLLLYLYRSVFYAGFQCVF